MNKKYYIRSAKKYKLGVDCPYGYYVFVSEKMGVDAEFRAYYKSKDRLLCGKHKFWFSYFTCVYIDDCYEYIELDNGKAYYYGETPLDLYNLLISNHISENSYSSEGYPLIKNKVIDLRLYGIKRNSEFFYKSTYILVNDQVIFSVNGMFFFAFGFDVRSYKTFDSISVFIYDKNDSRLNDVLLCDNYLNLYTEQFSFRGNNDNYIFDRKRKIPFCIHNLKCNYNEFIIDGVKIDDHRMNTITTKTIKETYEYDFIEFRSILQKYKDLGLVIDVDKEMMIVEETPDLARVSCFYLNHYYHKRELFDGYRGGKREFVFKLIATYNKEFYTVAKISEDAKSIAALSDYSEFYITIGDNNPLELALLYMIYTRHESFVESEDCKVLSQFLVENEFFIYLGRMIAKACSKLREKYDNSYGYLYHSIFMNFQDSIHKYYRSILNMLYKKMVTDNRVATKWGNEYSLYKTIKYLFPDAIYQYRPEWLDKQTFDIYIPSLKTAVEYQGKQHYESVDFFGGEKNLLENIDRDRRKMEVSNNNGVNLLCWNYKTEVTPSNTISFFEDNGISIDCYLPTIITGLSSYDIAPVINRTYIPYDEEWNHEL